MWFKSFGLGGGLDLRLSVCTCGVLSFMIYGEVTQKLSLAVASAVETLATTAEKWGLVLFYLP